MNRAVFLDRDGVINQKAPDGQYISNRREFVLLPGVVGAVRELCDAGFLVFVATNQRGIARQRVNAEDLDCIHSDLLRTFCDAGATITQIYVCPHEDGCRCRKPEPGMLLRAAREHALDLRESWIVGDSVSDVEAGKRAGCRTIRIKAEPTEPIEGTRADVWAKNLPQAVRFLLRNCKNVGPQGSESSQQNL